MNGGSTLRVLVAGDDYYASLATVRGLRAGGYEPWFAACTPNTYASRSRATAGTVIVPQPSEGAAAYVSALADTAARISARAVLPGNELSIKALAGREAAFPNGVAVGSNPPHVVRRATDKAVLTSLAAEVGLSAPPTVEVTHDDLESRRAELSFPAVLKPASSAIDEPGRTWMAPPTRVVASFEELERAVEHGLRWLAQPLVHGSLIAVSGVAWRGEVVCSAHQTALRIYPPVVGVSAYAETVPRDPALDRVLAELVGRIGWSGIFEFQLIRSDDAAYLIDLNPRPYGSLALAIGAGLNLPTVWADLVLGRSPATGSYRPGVRYRAESREGKAVLSALSRGRFREALALLRPRRHTVHAVFQARDPAPLISLLGNATKKVAKRNAA